MGSPEAAKKRILPIWMTQRVVEPQQAETKPKRRKKAVLARSETVYCMNEAELVDMALCILAENCKGKASEVTSSSEDEVKEPQQVLSDHLSSMSESNSSSIPTIGSKPPEELSALSCSENTKSEEEDDALKYVREIFFT